MAAHFDVPVDVNRRRKRQERPRPAAWWQNTTMGAAARARAVDAFGYDALAADLLVGIRAATADGGPAIAPAAPGM